MSAREVATALDAGQEGSGAGLVQLGHFGDAVARHDRQRQDQPTAGLQDGGDPAKEVGARTDARVQDETEQRAPRELDAHLVRRAVELLGQVLGGGQHEQHVVQATPGRLREAGPERRGAGVDRHEQLGRIAGRPAHRELGVARADVDRQSVVLSRECSESADVDVAQTTMRQNPHTRTLPLRLGTAPARIAHRKAIPLPYRGMCETVAS